MNKSEDYLNPKARLYRLRHDAFRGAEVLEYYLENGVPTFDPYEVDHDPPFFEGSEQGPQMFSPYYGTYEEASKKAVFLNERQQKMGTQ